MIQLKTIKFNSFKTGFFKDHEPLLWYNIDISRMKNQSLPDATFEGLKNAYTVLCSPFLKNIGDRAFASCGDITRVDANLEYIGNESFAFCSSLKSFNFKNVKFIDDGAFRFSGIEEFEAGSNLAVLKKNCFECCTNLKKVYLNKVEVVEEKTFSGANISLLELTENIKELKNYSFESCIFLNTVICRSKTPPKIYQDTFIGCHIKKFIFNNKGLMNKYAHDSNWKKYKKLFIYQE